MHVKGYYVKGLSILSINVGSGHGTWNWELDFCVRIPLFQVPRSHFPCSQFPVARYIVFNGRMAQDQPTFNVRQFAAAARITVPEARLPALAAGLATTLNSMAGLLALEFGGAEPASRFRAPPSAHSFDTSG